VAKKLRRVMAVKDIPVFGRTKNGYRHEVAGLREKEGLGNACERRI